MAIGVRFWLLEALFDRGVLDEFVHDGELSQEVFHAAAAIPINNEELAEARILRHLNGLPAEEAARAMEQMRAEGFNETLLKIDAKFLAAVRAAQ